ncbi:MAG: hypothetical protein NC417_03095 [Candidatus Gastranaerophilales bacterium]|nr:hypothetical protein [Candidatus Gastranaerophilales bacterium]
MTTFYWLLEYGKVFLAYMFILFVWPSVVFRRFLRGRSLTFRFGFCVTFQNVLVNTVVLALGLVHLLQPLMVQILFYATFLCSLARDVHWGEKQYKKLRRLINGTYGVKKLLADVAAFIGGKFRAEWEKFLRMMQGHWWEYGLLSAILLYGAVYFSYGAFQDYSYGFGDMYPHNAWIYGLSQGQIFSAGVYPEGMHCFLYAMHTLFGIRIYSCLLFTAGVHSLIFLLAAYVLFKEVFRWRYTPMLALAAFLTVDVVCINEIYSMSRLQWTLPQEFGLFTQFLCAAFLVRYLRLAGPALKPEGGFKALLFKSYRPIHVPGAAARPPEYTKNFWDENLLVFLLALAASLAIHFYVTIMAFFLCVAFVPAGLAKILNPKRLIPLVAAAVSGFVIAVLPMAGALASGIPFQGSIGWAMSVINGTEGEGGGEIILDESGEEITGNLFDSFRENQDNRQPEQDGQPEQSGQDGQSAPEQEYPGAASFEAQSKLSWGQRIERLGGILWNKLQTLYNEAYVTLYRPERAKLIAFWTVVAFVLWLAARVVLTGISLLREGGREPSAVDGYFSLALSSVIFMAMYCAGSLGLPSLIAGSRLCSVTQLLILGVMMIPADLLLGAVMPRVPETVVRAVSILGVAAIYLGTMATGTFHGYLYYELTRYNAAVMVTYSVTDRLPAGSFTVVSTVDELYQLNQYGYHEEAITFVNSSDDETYSLPSEHVFIYVEKKPLEYAQSHFFTGPKWLAWEKYPSYYQSFVSQCPDITASRISEDGEIYRGQFADSSRVYSDLEQRTMLESKLYHWCREFEKLYPGELHTYYEDDDFVCYYIRQNTLSQYSFGIL